jgi:hypothetical protein
MLPPKDKKQFTALLAIPSKVNPKAEDPFLALEELLVDWDELEVELVDIISVLLL